MHTISIDKELRLQRNTKKKLYIANLQVLKDQKGPFGNPCSDSERTMITSTVDKILITILDFRGDHELAKAMKEAIELFQTYCHAKTIKTRMVC